MGHNLRRPGTRVAAVLLAALLGACETAGGDPSASASGATSQTDAADGDQASPEVATLPPEPEIDDDPERLLGLGPDALSDLLGQPELIRRESPAQVWQYRSVDCVFDVVLYQEAGREKVTYVEARDGDGDRTEPRPCLNQLLRAHLAAASS
jgi:hypothetical protein